jgi:hypothetical protein
LPLSSNRPGADAISWQDPAVQRQQHGSLDKVLKAVHPAGEQHYCGPLHPLFAVEHSVIIAIWHILTDHVPYQELVSAYFTQRDPERCAVTWSSPVCATTGFQ